MQHHCRGSHHRTARGAGGHPRVTRIRRQRQRTNTDLLLAMSGVDEPDAGISPRNEVAFRELVARVEGARQ